MRAEIEQALGALRGLPLTAMGRTSDLLWLEFGRRPGDSGQDGEGGAGGELVLHVACPWRLHDAERILVGSGDLLTPADADEELETFDWEAPGASWLDVRLAELQAMGGDREPAVESVAADALGGFRLVLGAGWVLEVFPNATPTGHVTTEFWRLLRPGSDEPHLVVGTFGVEREAAG